MMSGRPMAPKDPDPSTTTTTTTTAMAGKPTTKPGAPQSLLTQLESQLQAQLAAHSSAHHDDGAEDPHQKQPFVPWPFKKASSKEDLHLPQQHSQEKVPAPPAVPMLKAKAKSTSVGSFSSMLSSSSIPSLSGGSSADLSGGFSTDSTIAGASAGEDGGPPTKPLPYSLTKKKKQMEMLARALENGVQPGSTLLMKLEAQSSAPPIPSFSQERRDQDDLEKGGDSDGDEEDEGSEGEDNTIREAKKKWNKIKMTMKRGEKFQGAATAAASKPEDEPDIGRMKSLRLIPKKIEMPSLMDRSFFSPPENAKKNPADGERPKIAVVMKPSVNLEERPAELPEKKKWYELSEVPIDITQLSEAEMKRQDTIHELIETEVFYLRDLEIIIEVFKNEMIKQKVVTMQEVNGLFSNIEQLVGVNQELLKLLKERQAKGVVMKIGDIFLQMASYFRMYNMYCSNQPDAMVLFNRLKENEVFQAFLKQCLTKKECRNLGLTAFLLEPIQRLCKYPLFMKDVVKNTPEDHVDYGDMKKAQQSIEKIVDEVNERRRLVENQQKVLAVQHACDFGEKWKSFALVIPTRKYIREGPLFKISKSQKVQERYAFLFNDILLWCSKKRLANSKFQVHQVLYLNRCIVVDNLDHASEDPSKPSRFTFNIIHSGEGRYIASLPEASQKRDWLDEIKELIAIFTNDQHDEYKDPKAEMIFSDEEFDDGADDSEEVVSGLRWGHSSSSSSLPSIASIASVTTTPPKPSVAPKEDKEAPQSGRVSPKTDTFPSLPTAQGEVEQITVEETDILGAPRPRKASAPNRPLPKPFARPDQNILASLQPSSIDGAGQIIPPLTKPVGFNPTASVASVSSNASTVSMASSADSAPETPAAGAMTDPIDPTDLRRQRSRSVPHVVFKPAFGESAKSPGEEKPAGVPGKPVIPPKPKPHPVSSGPVPGFVSPPPGDREAIPFTRPPPPALKPKPVLPAGTGEPLRR